MAGTYDSSKPPPQPVADPQEQAQTSTQPIEEIGNDPTNIFALTGIDFGGDDEGAGGGGENPQPEAAQGGQDSTGFGLAGSVNVVILSDITRAFISGPVKFNVAGVTVSASDDSEIIGLVGGAAIGLATNTGGSTVIAGAANINIVDFDTEASLTEADSIDADGSA